MRAADLPPLPEAPGVYLFKRGDEVIYVGKAKNLKHRVKSYFPGEGKAREIREHADGLEFIVARDEVEALLLEANLIKAHRPIFNVLLKDDKHYPFLKLTHEPFPMLQVVRQVKDDGARYWGPFPNASAVRRIKAFVDRHFLLRKNSGSPMKRRRRPCLNHAMGRCLAPCVGAADPAAYAREVERVSRLLSGEVEAVIQDLEAEMQEAAKGMLFERAAEIRDTIQALKAFFATEQQAVLARAENLDFLGFARQGGYVSVQLFQVRQGRVLGRVSRFVEGTEDARDEEVLFAFLRDYYLEASPLPRAILLPFAVEGADTLAEALRRRAGHRVRILVPRRGEKKRLLDLAQQNAAEALRAEMLKLEKKGDHPALKSLKERLGLAARPYRIEGFDISTLFGEDTVASIVVFEGGRPKKSDYRRLIVRGVKDRPNDYAAMEEAVRRRFSGRLAELPVPDLILIDGGLGQLRVARAGLKAAGMNVPLVGLEKREETLVLESGRRLALPLDDPGLRLLIYLRDEAHRVAVEFGRKRRKKRTLKSVFDDLPGVGPKRRQALLSAFSSLEELRAAPVEVIARLPGFNARAAAALKAALENSDG